ncbi:MAG TPA: DUF2569 family protein [Ignavibacteria bacterium]|nr:DUF2569 family protein [Ignavibacteria bacterium]
MPNKKPNYPVQTIEILADTYGGNSKCGQCKKRKTLSSEELNQKFFICEKCGIKNYINQQTDYTGLDGWLLIFYLLNIFLLIRNIFNLDNYIINYERVFNKFDDTTSHTIIFWLLIVNIILRLFLSIIYFTKDKLIPSLFKIYCIIDIIISFIITVNYSLIIDSMGLKDNMEYEDKKSLMFLFFFCRASLDLIFFLYLTFSKRVKSTFTKHKKFLHPLY